MHILLIFINESALCTLMIDFLMRANQSHSIKNTNSFGLPSFITQFRIPPAEQEAARLASAHRSDSAAAQHHLSATKDVVLGPLHAGNNHVPNYQPGYPSHSHQQSAGPHHVPAGHGYWPQPYAPFAAMPSGSGAADWPTYETVKSGYNLWG